MFRKRHGVWLSVFAGVFGLVCGWPAAAHAQSVAITSMSRGEGPAGTVIRLSGSGFNTLYMLDRLGNRFRSPWHVVRFTGPEAPTAQIAYVSDQQLDVTVPGGATVGPIAINMEVDLFDQNTFQFVRTRTQLAVSTTFWPTVILHIDNQSPYLINRMNAYPVAGGWWSNLLPSTGFIGNPRGSHSVEVYAQAYNIAFDIGTLPPNGVPIRHFTGSRAVSLVSGPDATFQIANLQPDWLVNGRWTSVATDSSGVVHQLRLECAGLAYTLFDRANNMPERILDRGFYLPTIWSNFVPSMGYRFNFSNQQAVVHGPESNPPGRWDRFVVPLTLLSGSPQASFFHVGGAPRLP